MKQLIKNKQQKSICTRGFTLVETMVAISILMLAILGPLSIASSGLRNSAYARDQIVAYYLAQEGIEFARYVRDYNYVLNLRQQPTEWDYVLSDCGSGCTIDTVAWFDDGNNNNNEDPASYVFSPCTPGCAASRLYLNLENQYTHNSSSGANPSTSYFRYIVVKDVDSDDGYITIESNVQWESRAGGIKEFQLVEDIYEINQ